MDDPKLLAQHRLQQVNEGNTWNVRSVLLGPVVVDHTVEPGYVLPSHICLFCFFYKPIVFLVTLAQLLREQLAISVFQVLHQSIQKTRA